MGIKLVREATKIAEVSTCEGVRVLVAMLAIVVVVLHIVRRDVVWSTAHLIGEATKVTEVTTSEGM